MASNYNKVVIITNFSNYHMHRIICVIRVFRQITEKVETLCDIIGKLDRENSTYIAI